MTDLTQTDEIFFKNLDCDQTKLERIVDDTLKNADDGELFLEYRQSESIVFDDGKVKSAAFDTTQGFGLRAITDETTCYSHASELSEKAIRRASNTILSANLGNDRVFNKTQKNTNQKSIRE